MHPIPLSRIVNGKLYSTKRAYLICGDDWWDGHNHERHGRNTFLYRTFKGNYFAIILSQWQGEEVTLSPYSLEQAKTFFEQCSQHDCNLLAYEDAFPGAVVEEA